MKIKNIVEPQQFFAAVNECKGHIELVTGEGDRLNLRSTLCQYIAITQMFQDPRVDSVELVLTDPSDYGKLRPYLITAEA